MATIIYNTLHHRGHITLNGVIGVQILLHCAGNEVAQLSFLADGNDERDITGVFDRYTSFNQNKTFSIAGASVNTITHHGEKKQVLTLHASIDPDKPTKKVEQEVLEVIKGLSDLKIEQI